MSNYIQDFDFNVDLMRCLLWQYNDATRLQSLLQEKKSWYEKNHTEFWKNWLRDVFDLRTADDFGLSVWGKILNESRDSYVAGAGIDYPAFGFGQYRKNFGNGNFRRAKSGYTQLETEQYRLLLRLKYFKLISRGTVPEINSFLNELFQNEGRVYVLDPLDMSFIVYVFTFAPSSWQRYILEDIDALPRPAGVGAKIRVVHRKVFGFGKHHFNFTGNFSESRKG